MPNFLGRIYENLTEEDLDFHLGEVTQVFLKPGDGNVGGGTDSQALHLQPLDSSLPTMGRQIIARPLIRGISESVTKGDLVIFTLIFKKAFYIGPVNSFNSPADGSNPTFTRKRKNKGQVTFNNVKPNGYGLGYPYVGTTKLIKDRSPNLDNLNDDLYNTSKHTDMIFEGRHGNAIRIGSRAINPSITISNGNDPSIPLENPMIGSIIGALSNGSIEQNFYPNKNKQQQSTRFFRLSTDSLNPIIDIDARYQIGIGNGKLPTSSPSGSTTDVLESLDTVYKYSEDLGIDGSSVANQILITSDKITMDARSNNGDFTISSGKNINIGAAQNFTLNNQGKSVINSGNIYLGQEARSKAEPMVLGEELRSLLFDIMNILQDSRALVQGVAIPLMDRNSEPMFRRIQSVIEELQPRTENETENSDGTTTKTITNDGPRFMSHHHYIETNRPNPNQEGQNNEG